MSWAETESMTDGCSAEFFPSDHGACHFGLTHAGASVIGLIAIGLTDREIASQRRVSPHTVRHQVHSAMQRANARSRSEMVAKCFAAGVLERVWPPRITGLRCLRHVS
jgi:DNA-binding CsgD family transcriptional regulator